MAPSSIPGPEIEQFRAEARAWLGANMEPRPRASRLGSSDSRTPEEIAASRIRQRKLFDGGWAGISYPKEYGGRGLTAAHDRTFRQEALAFVMPDFGGAGHVMFGAIGRSLLAHASPVFLQRHIPKLLSGEELWCQFYSEPEAGSDLAGIRTSATRDGDRWILRGSKIWSTGANHADYAMCLARTDWGAPKHRGLTWFAVATGSKGLTIRTIVQINGAAGFCEEFLDDVEVTDDDIIGEVNMGPDGRPDDAGLRTGCRRRRRRHRWRPRRLAPDLVGTGSIKVGQPTPPTRWPGSCSPEPTSMTTPSFTWGVGWRHDSVPVRRQIRPSPPTASWRRGRWRPSGRASPSRSPASMPSRGMRATAQGERPATDYLNGRMGSIAAGTNEMQRNGIGERVLGLPREPSFDSRKPFAEVVHGPLLGNWDGRAG